MAEPLTPYSDDDVALIRQRLDRLKAARLPLGEGDKIDDRWLATLDAARAAAPSPEPRTCRSCGAFDGHAMGCLVAPIKDDPPESCTDLLCVDLLALAARLTETPETTETGS